MRFITKKRVAAAAAAAVIAGGGMAAYAYFTGGGSGTGSASTGSNASWTVTVGAVAGGPVYPGAGSETLPATVTNAGGGNQKLQGVSAAVPGGAGDIFEGGSVTTTHVGCKASWYSAGVGTMSPVVGSTIASGSSATGNVTVTMSDSGTNQDVCKGATPDVTVTAS